jgi:hypothetical protein
MKNPALRNVSIDEKLELARQAEDLKGSDMFKHVMKALRQQYMDEFMSKQVGDLTVQASHAKLRALDDIHASLTALETDAKMAGNKK